MLQNLTQYISELKKNIADSCTSLTTAESPQEGAVTQEQDTGSLRGDVRPQPNLTLSFFLDSYTSSIWSVPNLCLGINRSMTKMRVSKSKWVAFQPHSQQDDCLKAKRLRVEGFCWAT